MWLNTLLCGICITTAAWIAVSYADEVNLPSDDVAMYVGDLETESTPTVVDLIAAPDFSELQPMPLRDMRAPVAMATERELAARRHAELLLEARHRSAALEMQQPATGARRSASAASTDKIRRDREAARRLQNHRSMQKYDRRQTTAFERTRHYSSNRYAYEYSNADGLNNARLSSSRRRGLHVPIATSRRR